MEVPARNHEGLWETCDTTNDSWSYAWYDQNWKDAKTILSRLVATVGRGGSYLLNVGPDGSGRILFALSNPKETRIHKRFIILKQIQILIHEEVH